MNDAKKTVVAVKGVIINKGKVLLVKRSSNDEVGAGTWECAGGKIDFGETLEQALVREVKEEVGLDVTVEDILYASTFNTNPNRQVVIITYLCSSNFTEVKLSSEHSEFRWCTKEDLKLLLESTILIDFEQHNVLDLNK